MMPYHRCKKSGSDEEAGYGAISKHNLLARKLNFTSMRVYNAAKTHQCAKTAAVFSSHLMQNAVGNQKTEIQQRSNKPVRYLSKSHQQDE
jgi:hypothetical protein